MGPEGVLLRGLGDLQNLPDALDDGLGHNAVLLIIGVLDGAAAFRLVDGRPHGGRDLVGVHDD
ncbi:Transposon-encoded protein TnpW, partial [Dysosmobacter welbionis]